MFIVPFYSYRFFVLFDFRRSTVLYFCLKKKMFIMLNVPYLLEIVVDYHEFKFIFDGGLFHIFGSRIVQG